jgi:hypothetical protein
MTLAICTWLWGDKYDRSHVERLAAGVRRHLKQAHRFLCLTERERVVTFGDGIERHAIKDPGLTQFKGCFARLRLFDPGWQRNRGFAPGDRVVNLDLDVVLTGGLDVLFDRPEPLVVLQGANAANPCPYNCSVFMFRAGAHSELWSDFSLNRLVDIPTYEFPDDQGWLWLRAPHAAVWPVGAPSGIYAFQKPGWPPNSVALPADARMVAFIGWRKPDAFGHLPWLKEHWRA